MRRFRSQKDICRRTKVRDIIDDNTATMLEPPGEKGSYSTTSTRPCTMLQNGVLGDEDTILTVVAIALVCHCATTVYCHNMLYHA